MKLVQIFLAIQYQECFFWAKDNRKQEDEQTVTEQTVSDERWKGVGDILVERPENLAILTDFSSLSKQDRDLLNSPNRGENQSGIKRWILSNTPVKSPDSY